MIPKRPLFQPRGVAAQPNYGAPIFAGLDFLYCGGQSARLDLVRNIYSASSPVNSVTPYGISTQNAAGSGTEAVSAANSAHLNYTGNFSVWVLVYYKLVPAILNYPAPLARNHYVTEGNNQGWAMGWDGTTSRFRFIHSNNNTASGYSTTDENFLPTAGEIHSYVGVCNTDAFLYRNGGLVKQTSANGVCASNTTDGIVTLGSVSAPSNGDILLLAAGTWGRPLTQGEIGWLAENPWSMFRPPFARNYLKPGAGGSAGPRMISSRVIGGGIYV